MRKAIFYKSSSLSVFFFATLLFVLSIPMVSLGQDSECAYEIPVNVAANRINITSLDNTDHAVVVHTLQDYVEVNTAETQVFVNNGKNDYYCEISNVWQRMDSNGNLDISFQLDALKDCEGSLKINDEFNILRVEGIKKEEFGGDTFCGESYMHIVGKRGPSR